MSTLQQRIKNRMHALGLSNAELAAACKVKPPTSFNWGSGKTKNIKGEPLLLAAKALGVTPDWLATGNGQMLIDDVKLENFELKRIKEKLQDWHMTASPRSAEVIDQLILLAEKNALREDDWTLIEQMAKRMKTPG